MTGINGLDGLSRMGEAVVLPTRNYGAPIDNYLEKKNLQQQAMRQGFIETPAVEGLFPDDYKDVMGRYYDLNRLASSYLQKGYNIQKPTTQEEFALRTQLKELQAQIEYDEQFARQQKDLFDQSRKAGLSGRYDVELWNQAERDYLNQRGGLDFGQRLDLGLPEVSTKQTAYSFADEFNKLKANILPQKDAEIYQQGTLYGEKSETYYPEESRQNMAVQLISNPRGEAYLSGQFDLLPKEKRQAVEKRAAERGTNPLYEYSLQVVNENLGQKQTDISSKQKNPGWARFGIEQGKYDELSDMILRNTAYLTSGQALQGDRSQQPAGPGLFAGHPFGEDRTIVRVDNTADKDGLWVITERPVKEDGIQTTKTERLFIKNENVWNQFITPMVKEDFGDNSKAVLDAMSRRYKEQYGGDTKNWDWKKVFPGKKTSMQNPSPSGVKWQSQSGENVGGSGISWK